MSNNYSVDDNIRSQIKSVAQSRFHIYGADKTTMAEIANDVNMSAANLYRYFKNKHELIEECVWDMLLANLESLQKIINQPSVTVALRLQEFMLSVVHQTHELIEKEPKFNNLIKCINSHGSKITLRQNEMEKSMIKELITEGKESKVFFVSNIKMTVQTIHAAIMFFKDYHIFTVYSLQELEDIVLHTNKLLLNGLLPR